MICISKEASSSEENIAHPYQEEITPEGKSKFQTCLSFFDPKTILESWKTCVKRRPYHKRTMLWLSISICCLQTIVYFVC